jgi:hypothetical protein
VLAEAALALDHVEGGHHKVGATDDLFAAGGTESRVALVTGHVADVDVVQALLVGDAGRALQRIDGRGGRLVSL